MAGIVPILMCVTNQNQILVARIATKPVRITNGCASAAP